MTPRRHAPANARSTPSDQQSLALLQCRGAPISLAGPGPPMRGSIADAQRPHRHTPRVRGTPKYRADPSFIQIMMNNGVV
jgi:hypothetical protein